MSVIDLSLEPGQIVDLLVSTPESTTINLSVSGPQGESGSSYTHNQAGPLVVWLISHNLGYKPAGVQAYEEVSPDVFVEVEGEIVHLNTNQFTIQFDVPISGYVLVS